VQNVRITECDGNQQERGDHEADAAARYEARHASIVT
jgi:hypothetical protein